jgi:chromosome partitioning protein
MGSLSSWWDERESETPFMAAVGKGGLKAAIKNLQDQGFDYLFCDTPPQANADIEAIIKLSDLVVIPVVPSPHDLRAIGATVELVERHNRPMVFVVSNASATGKLTLQAVTALSAHGTVAPVIIKTRQDYRSSMIKGLTVGEAFPKSKSTQEITELWAYIQTRLKKGAS